MPPLDKDEITLIAEALSVLQINKNRPTLPMFILETTAKDHDEFSIFLRQLHNKWSVLPRNTRLQILLYINHEGIHWVLLDLQKTDGLSIILADLSGTNTISKPIIQKSLQKIFQGQQIQSLNIKTHFHNPYCGAFSLDAAFQLRKQDLHTIFNHDQDPQWTWIQARLFRLSQVKTEIPYTLQSHVLHYPKAIGDKVLHFRRKTLTFSESMSEHNYQKILAKRTGRDFLQNLPYSLSYPFYITDPQFIGPAKLKILSGW